MKVWRSGKWLPTERLKSKDVFITNECYFVLIASKQNMFRQIPCLEISLDDEVNEDVFISIR